MITEELKSQLKKAITHLQRQFAQLQAGRANTTMVEDLQVESYGAYSPLKNIANIGTPDAKTIRIEPWDKSVIGEIEKAILQADLGINPQNMGEYILLPIPPMTEDRRKALVKIVHEEGEHAKISIRNARAEARDLVKMQKDDKEISEDQAKDLENDIQAEVDKANKEIDEMTKAKEKDILSI